MDRTNEDKKQRASDYLDKYRHVLSAVAPIERRRTDDPDDNYGRRSTDVRLVMNGTVALLTLDGMLYTAGCLAELLLWLDERERGSATG
jgi:hypothetical protein